MKESPQRRQCLVRPEVFCTDYKSAKDCDDLLLMWLQFVFHPMFFILTDSCSGLFPRPTLYSPSKQLLTQKLDFILWLGEIGQPVVVVVLGTRLCRISPPSPLPPAVMAFVHMLAFGYHGDGAMIPTQWWWHW